MNNIYNVYGIEVTVRKTADPVRVLQECDQGYENPPYLNLTSDEELRYKAMYLTIGIDY